MVSRKMLVAVAAVLPLALLAPTQAHGPLCSLTGHTPIAPVQAGNVPPDAWFDTPNGGIATLISPNGPVVMEIRTGPGCVLTSFCFSVNGGVCLLPVTGGQLDHVRVTGTGDFVLTFV